MGVQESLKALSDPTRRQILQLLKKDKMSAGDITKQFAITGAAISRHLSVLKEAGFIHDKREGKFIYYKINLDAIQDILEWLKEF